VLDFYTLEDSLAEFDPVESPAYLHGSLMARLVCGQRLNPTEWWQEAAATLDIDAGLAEHPEVLALYDESLDSLKQMKPNQMGPELLLPDANNPLIDRMEALAQWCDGFISTLGLVNAIVEIDEEDANLLTDLANVSQLDPHSAEPGDSGEADFETLVEHTRMACRYFYERFAPPSGAIH